MADERAGIVSRDPEIMSGDLVFAGTRVPAQNLVDYLKANDTLDSFLEDFPTVSREQAVAYLDLTLKAADLARSAKNVPKRLLRYLPQKFEMFLTVDRNIPHQQDPSRFDLAVVVLRAESNSLKDLSPLVERASNVLATARPGEAVSIEA